MRPCSILATSQPEPSCAFGGPRLSRGAIPAPARPKIVTVETFTHAQLMRRSKAAGGLVTARKAERGGRRTARDYMLRGLVRCGICQRKMQGATIRAGAYYRCTARTMAPGSALLR